MTGVLWKTVAVLGSFGLVAYLVLPTEIGVFVYPAFGLALVVSVIWTTSTGRVVIGRHAWRLFALAMGLWVVGDVMSSVLELANPNAPAPFPSIADAVYLAGYPVLAVAIIEASRLRGPRRDGVAGLDGLMVALAAAIPIWVLWIGPATRDGDATGLALVATLAYPLLDLLLIACGTRFVLGGGRWSPAAILGVTGLGISIITDVAFNVSAMAGTYQPPDPLDLGFLLCYLTWTVMALHPSATTMLEGGHRVHGVSYRARTWALVAIVALPLSVLAVSYVRDTPVDGSIVIGIFVLICAAMVLRLRLIARAGSTAWRGPALLSGAALVVVVAAVGLTSVQQRSRDAEQAAGRLTEIVMIAERLEGLALRASSADPGEARVGRLGWAAVIDALRERTQLIGPALRKGDGAALKRQIQAYDQALARQLRLLDAGRAADANDVGARDVDAAHDAFIAGTRDLGAEYRRLAARSATNSRLSTVLALALSLTLLTLLLVRFGGVGRRAQLAHQALHDSLTGLPNRALIEDRLRQTFSRSMREHELHGYVMLDLDDFKAVNDSLGHPIGDELLRAVAERLGTCVRPGDTLARVGGDGFAILLGHTGTPGDAVATAERMLATLEAPFEIAGITHLAQGSVGIAVSDGAGSGSTARCAATVLRDAELAMYAAKEREGNSYELFTKDLHGAVAKRVELKAELAQAIRNEEFTLAYQPIVDIPAREVVGYEALLRWIHPERGFVSPAEFIPLAEQTGLIVELGTWVLREACRQLVEWREQGAPERYVSVNVAGNQLQRADFAEQVAAALRDTGLPASALLLEVTESSLILDIDGSQRRMDAVRELGVRFAIDDFGTGYSSLSYLSRFPLDVLKIDKSFIDEIAVSPRGRAIVDAIVNMAASLDLAVVAEGIEHPEQAQALAEIGCGLGQGYFYARPMPPVDVPGFELEPALRVVKTA